MNNLTLPAGASADLIARTLKSERVARDCRGYQFIFQPDEAYTYKTARNDFWCSCIEMAAQNKPVEIFRSMNGEIAIRFV